MPHTDLPLAELRRYAPQLPAPEDLWDFWRATLDEAAELPLDATCTPVDSGLVTVIAGQAKTLIRATVGDVTGTAAVSCFDQE